MDIKAARADSQAEWFEIHTRWGTCKVLVEPLANREFRDLWRKLRAPYSRYMKKHDGELPPGIEEELEIKVLAETIVRDWTGIEGDDGPVPFSVEKAMEVLEIDQFRFGVLKAATELQEVYAVEMEDTAKN